MEKDLYRGRRKDLKAGPHAPDKTGKPITPGKMMASAASILNKSFKEAKEKQEYDYEGDMAMSQLKSIIANAQRIHDMLERDTNIPEWVQSKITLAEDYITTAANYMQGEMKEDVPVNVAANVADPQNKRLFAKPAKRKIPSFKSFTGK
jgi:serine protease inhibitor